MYLSAMNQTDTTGLGELLRHLTDLLDRGSQDAYQDSGLSFRPRYTPIMRALEGEPVSVSELCERLRITQGAISQTLKLMEADNLVDRVPTQDSRSRAIILTTEGQALRKKLMSQWHLRLLAISELEAEIDLPLRSVLKSAIDALETEGFAHRLARISPENENE